MMYLTHIIRLPFQVSPLGKTRSTHHYTVAQEPPPAPPRSQNPRPGTVHTLVLQQS